MAERDREYIEYLISTMEDLKRSLVVRNLNNEEALEKAYGKEIGNKFGGMCRLVQAFVDNVDNIKMEMIWRG